jgi:alpha-aminoadipic semialdehyde synthase
MKGFARTAQGLLEMGLIDPNPSPFLHPSGPDITWVSTSVNYLTIKPTSLMYQQEFI